MTPYAQKVKERIQQLIPKVKELTLAVVLKAIAKEGYNTLDMLIGPSDIAIFRDRVISEDSFEWNLNFDFDLQSEATQAFIGQVLGVEE